MVNVRIMSNNPFFVKFDVQCYPALNLQRKVNKKPVPKHLFEFCAALTEMLLSHDQRELGVIG